MHFLAEFFAPHARFVFAAGGCAVEGLAHEREGGGKCEGFGGEQDLAAGFLLDARGGGEISLECRFIQHVGRRCDAGGQFGECHVGKCHFGKCHGRHKSCETGAHAVKNAGGVWNALYDIDWARGLEATLSSALEAGKRERVTRLLRDFDLKSAGRDFAAGEFGFDHEPVCAGAARAGGIVDTCAN